MNRQKQFDEWVDKTHPNLPYVKNRGIGKIWQQFYESLLEERERDLKAWKHLAESRQRIMNNWIEKYDLPIHEATLDLNQKEF